MSQEQRWVIAYDSPSNKRRRKLAKLLEGYGERLQWSVFECRLQPHQLRRLRQLLACIATAEDSVRIWAVPQRPLPPSPPEIQAGSTPMPAAQAASASSSSRVAMGSCRRRANSR